MCTWRHDEKVLINISYRHFLPYSLIRQASLRKFTSTNIVDEHDYAAYQLLVGEHANYCRAILQCT